jgi:hypothetical protein
MAMTLHVDIVSAEEEIFSGTAEMVIAPAEMGEVGIMPRHTPLITRLKPGEVICVAWCLMESIARAGIPRRACAHCGAVAGLTHAHHKAHHEVVDAHRLSH